MSMTDPIAHMLTKIRNATMVKKAEVEIPSSKMKAVIAKILKQEGYIKGYEVIPDNKQGILKLKLKYDDQANCVIVDLQRVSKPSRRVYVAKDEIPSVLSGMGIAILSTSKGMMTDRAARQAGVGGEIICYVW
ncbi:MAG: 30S ribosomal protein S8 [Desulfobacterales bacterium]|jgi:small subunit ribosomal protein S8|nr:30S ribosomal protein S8 [Desulfobacterales bacterium]